MKMDDYLDYYDCEFERNDQDGRLDNDAYCENVESDIELYALIDFEEDN